METCRNEVLLLKAFLITSICTPLSTVFITADFLLNVTFQCCERGEWSSSPRLSKLWTVKTKSVCVAFWPVKYRCAVPPPALAQCEMKAVLWTLWIYSSSHHIAQWHSRLDAFQSINGTQEGKFQLYEWKNTSGSVAFSFFFFSFKYMCQWFVSPSEWWRVSPHNEAQAVLLCNYRNPVSCENTPRMQQ